MQPDKFRELLSKRPWDYWLLWFVALSGLALNVWLINTLLMVRRQAAEAATVAAQEIERLRTSTVQYTVKINQSIPLAVNVPINQTFAVPVNETISISTTIQVPFEIPLLGTRLFDVPIRTDIPLQLDVDIPVNVTIPITTIVPVRLDVPLNIAIADTPIDASLERAQSYLAGVPAQLGLYTPTPTPHK